MWKNAAVCIWPLVWQALVTAYKQPCAIGQTDSELYAMPGWACCSGCLAVWLLVMVAGILQAWEDMWFIPAGRQSNNSYTAHLLVSLNVIWKLYFSHVWCKTCFIFLYIKHILGMSVAFHFVSEAQSQTEARKPPLHPSLLYLSSLPMLRAYLRTGGLAAMRNSGIVRTQWLLSQSSS